MGTTVGQLSYIQINILCSVKLCDNKHYVYFVSMCVCYRERMQEANAFHVNWQYEMKYSNQWATIQYGRALSTNFPLALHYISIHFCFEILKVCTCVLSLLTSNLDFRSIWVFSEMLQLNYGSICDLLTKFSSIFKRICNIYAFIFILASANETLFLWI